MKAAVPIRVKGNCLDNETRCVHYHTDLDIVAIKFKCCQTYYPCFKCHAEDADHFPQQWKKEELKTKAILCGACKAELTIQQYFKCNYTCPFCSASFNPGCQNHNYLYFEIEN
ncbi:MAG: hypothetical protein H7096_04315 [Flavobacterium sp.]|nr:hypothetical protein [Pedobacter sp.]